MDQCCEPQEVIANVVEVERGVEGWGTDEQKTGLVNGQTGQARLYWEVDGVGTDYWVEACPSPWANRHGEAMQHVAKPQKQGGEVPYEVVYRTEDHYSDFAVYRVVG